MRQHLIQLLKDHNLLIRYEDIEGPGYLVPTPGKDPDFVVVPKNDSEEHIEEVIYHEIGHKLNDKDIPGNYKDDYCTHIKCEACANAIKIKFMVADYAALGYDISTSNYVDIAHAIGTDNYDKVKSELEKYNKSKY